ncbi:MAG: right-handed parallel beta-helix repeat-containing protein, partial [Actinomycetota bacterium]
MFSRIPWSKPLLLALVAALVGGIVPATARAQVQVGPCTGVEIQPGDDVQSVLSAMPRDVTFCFKPGTYYLSSALKPKQGQQLIGEPGVVLDGSHAAGQITGIDNSASGVTVRNMEIRNFTVGVQGASGWTIEDNDIHHNSMEGARLSHETLFRRNHTHHNTRAGVHGWGRNIRVINNEIDNNQSDTTRCSQKFVWTEYLVFRFNYVHDNRCPAVWADISSYRPLIARNRVENNRGPGIDCEISYNCIIRFNKVRNNGAGIIVSSTPNARVYGNTVTGNGE